MPSVTTNLKLIICASAPQSNGISRAYSKAAEIGGPETPSTTAVDIQDDYEAKYGAVSAGNPKVFFKYFFVNASTGEKSGDMLAVAHFEDSEEQPAPQDNNPGGQSEGGNQGGGESGGDNSGGGIAF